MINLNYDFYTKIIIYKFSHNKINCNLMFIENVLFRYTLRILYIFPLNFFSASFIYNNKIQ